MAYDEGFKERIVDFKRRHARLAHFLQEEPRHVVMAENLPRQGPICMAKLRLPDDEGNEALQQEADDENSNEEGNVKEEHLRRATIFDKDSTDCMF